MNVMVAEPQSIGKTAAAVAAIDMHAARMNALRQVSPSAPPVLVHLAASMLGDSAMSNAVLQRFATFMEHAARDATDLPDTGETKAQSDHTVRLLASAVRIIANRRAAL